MDNVLKKTLLLGLGIGSMTKKKIEKLVKELVKKGEISAKEGKKMSTEFVEKSKKQADDVKKIIDLEVKIAIKKMPFATKADVKALERKIEKLSQKKKASKIPSKPNVKKKKK